MIYCPDSKLTLPLNVRQAVADQQHSPRVEKDIYDESITDLDMGIHPWLWMVENWDEHDWKDFALDSQFIPEDSDDEH